MTATASETEALLLEYNLIKRHRPRYNVTLRDDKSFPYLYITTEQDYPRISFYRGSRKLPGRFFGPYPNARATRETVLLLQKLFLLRPCSDTFFANRSRPCLQYQIKRCSGPCVGLISVEDYKQDVADAIKVLEGRGAELIDDLAQRMEDAAQKLEFERAARLRDQINGIKAIHSTQSVTRNVTEDIDAVALVSHGGDHCVSIVFVRGGRNLGSTNFFPRAGLAEESELLSGFLAQYYLGRDAPGEILISQPIEDCRSARRHVVGAHGTLGADPLRRPRRARALARNGADQCRGSVSTCAARPRQPRPNNCSPSPRCSDSARRRSAWSVST